MLKNPDQAITDEEEYSLKVNGGTVYAPIHLLARRDFDLPANRDELPDSVTVEYRRWPDGSAEQVISMEQFDE